MDRGRYSSRRGTARVGSGVRTACSNAGCSTALLDQLQGYRRQLSLRGAIGLLSYDYGSAPLILQLLQDFDYFIMPTTHSKASKPAPGTAGDMVRVLIYPIIVHVLHIPSGRLGLLYNIVTKHYYPAFGLGDLVEVFLGMLCNNIQLSL